MHIKSGLDKQANILVADDDPATRLLIRAALEQSEFAVLEAADGESALETFQDHAPDIVLLDVEMPVMDGFEACRSIRRRSGGQNVPVVMITGLDDNDSINQAYDAGATDFIVKPIQWALIGHRLRYILRSAQTLRALEVSEAENRALVEAIPDRIFVVNREAKVTQYLSKEDRLGDVRAEDLVGRRLADLMPVEVTEQALQAVTEVLAAGQTHSFEFKLQVDSLLVRHYESRFVAHGDDQVLAIVRDISERKEAEAKINQLAYYDTLTGLPNRQLFQERLQSTISAAERHDEKLAILYVDLDRFKRINDTLGHGAGDALLKSVAKRLVNCVRPTDVVALACDTAAHAQLARLGGDEFTILLTRINSEKAAVTVANRIKEALSRPFQHGAHEFVVTPSIGMAMYPEHGLDPEMLMKNADTAMYRAKSCGRNNYKLYSSTMNVRSLERLDLENDLRRALEEDALEMHYQPKVRISDRRIVGAEALVRWQHPSRGSLSPEMFIALAEETGLILDLGRWVANTVCRQMADWRNDKVKIVPVSINISGQEFSYADPLGTMLKATELASLDTSYLELEITETALMHDVSAVRKTLSVLKESGFSLAIDDFGTGYSSLGYLKSFPLDALKIDKSFVNQVNSNSDDASICKVIIALGHSLDLRVIAEGVETEEQLNFLRNRACDEVQGYLFSRPLPADEFEELINRQNQQTDTTADHGTGGEVVLCSDRVREPANS